MSEPTKTGGAKPAMGDGDGPLKKFYAAATVGPLDGYGDKATVLLDGRPLRTPNRAPLAVPPRIAEVMAAEWHGQDTHILPETMPVTRIANTAIDGVATAFDQVAEDVVAFAGNDLVYYRADRPEGLVAAQKAHWDPVLRSAEARFGVALTTTVGVMPVTQDGALAAAVRGALPSTALDLAALHQLTTLTGSALIALWVADGGLQFAAAWAAAHVDEDWNIKEWGEDAEAAERRARRERDAEAAAFILAESRRSTP
ncbi:MAG: ATP12 family protein [Pseudomonadota bacterium]